MTQSKELLGAKILIVDDQEVNIRLLELILQREGFTQVRSLTDPHDVLPTYVEYQPDIILLDLLMPGIDGFAVMELLRRRMADGVFLPILVLTADVTTETRRRALALGAKDFLTKPFDPIEVVLRIWNLLETRFMYLQIKQQNLHLSTQVQRGLRDLDAAQAEVIWRLAQVAEFHEEETGIHTQRVGRLAAQVARALGIDDVQVELIRHAAPLHDVGKIAIPDHILRKPGMLSVEEIEHMKQHSTIGARILSGSNLPLLQTAYEIALFHHERWDGTGYPQAIKGRAIPISARIVAVADAYDALTHERPYKRAWTIEESIAEIHRCSGTRYDPQVVDALITVLIQQGALVIESAPRVRRSLYDGSSLSVNAS
jgi:putative two-component system response regulator